MNLLSLLGTRHHSRGGALLAKASQRLQVQLPNDANCQQMWHAHAAIAGLTGTSTFVWDVVDGLIVPLSGAHVACAEGGRIT